MIPKSSILLIEDEENIRSFIATTLKNQNYKIITASSGTEGLHLSASLCPDLVLLDLGLPDMDGMTVIKKLREWNSTPIIVISARSHEQETAVRTIISPSPLAPLSCLPESAPLCATAAS